MRQDGRSVDQRTLDDFQARRERTRSLARHRPSNDLFDTVAQMHVELCDDAAVLEQRVRGYDLPVALRDEALSVCRQVAASASRHGFDLAEIRLRLLRRGIKLSEAA